MARSHHTFKLLHGQRGGVAILFALCLPVLLAFAALAIDLARLNLTKAELQNAADAAALAGARSISDSSTVASDQPYNWSAATATALVLAQHNLANGALIPIRNVTIETGYWNLNDPSPGLYHPGTLGEGDVPAIRATLAMPLNLLFAPIMGITESNVQASAIAVLPAPGGGTGIFPLVISRIMFDTYWNAVTRRPALDPATGKPYILNIGSIFSGVNSGTWTTFTTEDNDVTTLRQLIQQGNPTNLSIGMDTWIQTGVDEALFADVPANKDVPVLVVDNVQVGSRQPIVAIAGFHIICTVEIGGKKNIRGQFIDNVLVNTTNPGTGNGLPLGAYSPPILVN